jgi:hypothetical protein
VEPLFHRGRTDREDRVRIASHFNVVGLFAVPGDFESVAETEHGMDFRPWRPGSGVMMHLGRDLRVPARR